MPHTLRQKIADLILNGELKPGDRLDEASLATRFGVSRTPIREAIRQLGASGLVDIRPRRSAVVRSFDRDELSEAFEAMGEIEALCAHRAALRMNQAERLRLRSLIATSQDNAKRRDRSGALDLDFEFHALLHEGCHNRMLQSVAAETRLKITPYSTSLYMLESYEANLEQPHQQHAEIAEAVLAGDADRAAELMREHIAQTLIVLQTFLDETAGRDVPSNAKETSR